MDEQPLEGAVREKALHTMREQTQRMEGLVKQMLQLSKIEAAPTHLFFVFFVVLRRRICSMKRLMCR